MTDEHIDIAMPIEEGRNIPGDVVAGLAAQTVPTRLWVSSSVGDRRYADARNHVKQYGKSSYVLMLENDDVITSKILSVDESTKTGLEQGFAISYQVAPTAMVGSHTIGTVPAMGHRPTWHIDINMVSGGTVGTLVRRITENEDADGAPSVPHGVYTGHAEDQGPWENPQQTVGQKLIGSRAYWGGLWDQTGANDGTNAPVRDGVIPTGEYYRATLVLDDAPLSAVGQFRDFRKEA